MLSSLADTLGNRERRCKAQLSLKEEAVACVGFMASSKELGVCCASWDPAGSVILVTVMWLLLLGMTPRM